MRLLHTAGKTHARFDDPNLVSHGGLIPALRLAQDIGLEDLARRHVQVAAKVGANAELKVAALVAGMVAGADTIDGMDLLRHGAFPDVVGGIRAPSTLGSFLRAFNHGTVRQLAAVHRRALVDLAGRTRLLPGADTLAFIDRRSSTSTPCSGGCTGVPSRAPGSATPRSRRSRCWSAG